jgi:hypothetical protein
LDGCRVENSRPCPCSVLDRQKPNKTFLCLEKKQNTGEKKLEENLQFYRCGKNGGQIVVAHAAFCPVSRVELVQERLDAMFEAPVCGVALQDAAYSPGLGAET